MLGNKQVIFSAAHAPPRGGGQAANAVAAAKEDLIKEKEIQKDKLNAMVEKSDKILLKISSVFPFDFFPDDIIIEVNQVDIICRTFFFCERRHSIAVKNIKDVFVETSPFFATLKIVDIGFVENAISIEFLQIHEAIKAGRLIQGLLLVSKEGIDLTKIEERKLADKLERLGQMNEAN